MYKKSPNSAPVSTVITNAVDHFYGHDKPRPSNNHLATTIGISPSLLSRIMYGKVRVTWQTAHKIAVAFSRNAEAYERLLAEILEAQKEGEALKMVGPLAFVGEWAKPNTALIIELWAHWPLPLRVRVPTDPMSVALNSAMTAGTNILVVANWQLPRQPKNAEAPSTDTEIWFTFQTLRDLNTERVGLFCVGEGACPPSGLGIRLTGVNPSGRYQSWAIVPSSHHSSHFIETSCVPETFIALAIGASPGTRGDKLPQQTDIDTRWETLKKRSQRLALSAARSDACTEHHNDERPAAWKSCGALYVSASLRRVFHITV